MSLLEWYDIDLNLIHTLQNGYTPLYFATANLKREVAELLIRHGADVNSKDNVSSPLIPISDISQSHYNNYFIIYLIFYE